MSRRLVGLVAGGTLLALAAVGARSAENTPPAPRTVVVELFTSQGCSSCPPADRLLAEMAGPARAAGRAVEIVPLAFHVDYWDGIGWPDPFASPAWSDRQRRYARWRGDEQIYTPQLVVAGGRHVVGSNRDKVDASIGWAATLPEKIAISAEAALDGDLLIVRVGARAIEPLGDQRPAVMVAVFDGGHQTSVERGENARRTLRNERVVRRLDEVMRIGGEADRTRWQTAVDPSWRREALGVVVFAQDLETGAILGAAAPRIVADRAIGGTR